MPKYGTELFGQVIYAPEISYDDLLALEEEIKGFVTASLEAAGGEYLSFESEGDRTFFQCAFQSCDQAIMEALARTFAKRMDKQLESKLLFVERLLGRHVFYAVNHRRTREEVITLPAAGPIDEALLAEGD